MARRLYELDAQEEQVIEIALREFVERNKENTAMHTTATNLLDYFEHGHD